MGTCAFCGHSRIYGQAEEVKQKCLTIVENLIQTGASDCFLVGDYGAFDSIAAAVCLSLKGRYPHIRVDLLIPYYTPHLDEYTKERYAKFDSVICPELENTPHRFRIIKANEYMVDAADIMIAYVKYHGGAEKTLEYAQRRKKQIINIASGSE